MVGMQSTTMTMMMMKWWWWWLPYRIIALIH